MITIWEYTSIGSTAFKTLEDAKKKCKTLPLYDCGGITYLPHRGFELRVGKNGPKRVPSSKTGRISYIRPRQ